MFKVIEGGHNAEAFLTFETREKDGHQSEQMTQWGRSFLVNYYTYYAAVMGQSYNGAPTFGVAVSMKDTGGIARTIPGSFGNGINVSAMAILSGAADATYGMQVGTGSSANAAGTVALVTQIANGVGAGQLSHGSTGFTNPSGSAPLSYTATRTFTNNSGGAITINEAGLAFSLQYTGAVQGEFLAIRDLTGGVAVNNGANTTGTYTLSYTIS